MTHKHIIMSRYFWELHRAYPDIPLLSNHAFVDVNFGPDTHLKYLGDIVYDGYDRYKEMGIPYAFEDISRLVYEITNKIYNDFTYRLEEYVMSSCILDYIELYHHPEMAKARETVSRFNKPPQQIIAEFYSKASKLLTSESVFPNNPISRSLRAGNSKMSSILQTVAMRGTPTDIDSRIFGKSITDGYLRGVRNLADQLMDSRTSAKALSYQYRPMQESEYLNRKLQLSAETLHNLHMTDCGTDMYENVTIKAGFLKDFLGKTYICPTTGTEKSVRRSDAHLNGKTVKMRLVNCCKHADAYGVCVTCLGELGLNIPKYTNLGHQCSINVQSPVGQLLLSEKHVTFSSEADEFVLSESDQRFIVPTGNVKVFKINPRLNGKDYKLRLLESEAIGINDLIYVDNIDDLSPLGITELTSVMFQHTMSNGTVDMDEISVSSASTSRRSSLSLEFLEFIKIHGWVVSDEGIYEIDMKQWDVNRAFMVMPEKQFSTPDFMKSIERFIRGESTRDVKSMVDYPSFPAALHAFHDLVSSKLSANISNLEAIMLSAMVRSLDKKDYRLPLVKSQGQLAKFNDIMFLRSMAPFMAYQGQAKGLFSEESYIYRNRPEHPLDAILMGYGWR